MSKGSKLRCALLAVVAVSALLLTSCELFASLDPIVGSWTQTGGTTIPAGFDSMYLWMTSDGTLSGIVYYNATFGPNGLNPSTKMGFTIQGTWGAPENGKYNDIDLDVQGWSSPEGDVGKISGDQLTITGTLCGVTCALTFTKN